MRCPFALQTCRAAQNREEGAGLGRTTITTPTHKAPLNRHKRAYYCTIISGKRKSPARNGQNPRSTSGSVGLKKGQRVKKIRRRTYRTPPDLHPSLLPLSVRQNFWRKPIISDVDERLGLKLLVTVVALAAVPVPVTVTVFALNSVADVRA